MPKSAPQDPDFGSGTYEVAGVGLVLNGVVLDGSDPDAVAAYHGAQAQEAPTEATDTADASGVDSQDPAPDATPSVEA